MMSIAGTKNQAPMLNGNHAVSAMNVHQELSLKIPKTQSKPGDLIVLIKSQNWWDENRAGSRAKGELSHGTVLLVLYSRGTMFYAWDAMLQRSVWTYDPNLYDS